MHKPALFALLLVAAGAVVSLIGAPGEPTAWSKSSWGMSQDDLKTAFGGTALVEVPDAPDTRFRLRDSNTFEAAKLSIPSLSIAGYDFGVFFLFGDATEGLHQVVLTPREPALAAEAMFHAVEVALTEKYGKPIISRDGEVSFSEWKTGTSAITLQYSAMKIGIKSLFLIYAPLKPSGNL